MNPDLLSLPSLTGERPASIPGANLAPQPPSHEPPSHTPAPGPFPGRWIPVIPESAPFTPEQRAWLNGFLAGLFSHVPLPDPGTSPAPKPLEPLTILFGSQTGNAENLAKKIAKEAGQRGFAPTVRELGACDLARLPAQRNLLIVTSTYGDGEPPDNARAFWDKIRADHAPRLEGVRFSLCALGDRNYPKFCQFGKDLDARLEQLGAQRVHPRQDCDVDFEEPFSAWLAGALNALSNAAATAPQTAPTTNHAASTAAAGAPPARTSSTPSWSRRHPFPARLILNRKLTRDGSAKDVRHIVVSIAGSGLRYEPGDALGVRPTNDPELVQELLQLLHAEGSEEVRIPGHPNPTPLRQALLEHLDITRIPESLLAAVAERTQNPELRSLLAPDAADALTRFLAGRQIVDLLALLPGPTFTPGEFVACLRPLQPRLYSIASSPLCHPDEVHLTVNIVRYTSHSRQRKGVCSTFLADRVTPDTPLPVYIHANPAFRPPPPDTPLIMVGPGTGIAPFRAFLQHRQAIAARGKNWLFFGDQHAATDFLYEDELSRWLKDGLLTRLDLAWSRDQAGKVYVQHRMLEHASELWRWLEEGAAFFVCGDASRMARDVDAALHKVVQIGGGLSPDQATDYIGRLRSDKRYCRDVY
ncbi:sulfite reductase subunit alpha [Limisphaera sp. 4302-co]|uniref:sulfite reductase subunit alpha n=1 Tax=Limisphaera sp. 4302-co TaxID=3400417 RepID=UPI003C2175C5